MYQSVPRDNGAELHHDSLETVISEAVPVLSLTILLTLAAAIARSRRATEPHPTH